KLPVRCKCSCLQKTRAPVSSLKAADSTHGVRATEPFKRRRAATISESETVACVSTSAAVAADAVSDSGSAKVFMGAFGQTKNPERLTQGFEGWRVADQRASIPAPSGTQ